jgi:hypothetical protein
MTVLRYLDVAVILVAAPIMLLIGVSPVGYLVGAGAWIAFRVLGIAVERAADATTDVNRSIAIRMGYMLGRLFALAIVVILVRKSDGQDAGLACLLVVVFGFTIQLATSAITRPRRNAGGGTR